MHLRIRDVFSSDLGRLCGCLDVCPFRLGEYQNNTWTELTVSSSLRTYFRLIYVAGTTWVTWMIPTQYVTTVDSLYANRLLRWTVSTVLGLFWYTRVSRVLLFGSANGQVITQAKKYINRYKWLLFLRLMPTTLKVWTAWPQEEESWISLCSDTITYDSILIAGNGICFNYNFSSE
jgi:hypothetical protein